MPKRKSITGDNSLVQIRKPEVPVYLRSGAFYQSLSDDEEEDDDMIMVPGNAMKADPSVSSCADAIHLFESLRFWMVEEIPAAFVKFALTQDTSPFPPAFWKEFERQFKWLQTLRKCVKGSIKYYWTKMQHIISSGNKELLEVAYNALESMPPDACELAIQSDSAECLRFVYEHSKNPYLGPGACRAAITYGSDEQLLAVVHELGAEWDAYTCALSAKSGKLFCLRYLHEHGCSWDRYVCTEAARSGALACLQYAHEQGCDWNEEVCLLAALYGHLQCLQYAHEHECPWDENVCEAAAQGQLPCLQYAHEQGCPWDESLCATAAWNGHFSCLKYMHEQGLPLDEETCEMAADSGSLECLKYLLENNCPCDDSACTAAAACGNLECLKYLHERGCHWDEDTYEAAAANDELSCLAYLQEQGCPKDQEIVYKALSYKHRWDPCYQYVLKHCTPEELPDWA